MGSRAIDRIVGITLGVVLGVAIVVVFVFFGSEGTIDAPRLNPGNGKAQPGKARNQEGAPVHPVR